MSEGSRCCKGVGAGKYERGSSHSVRVISFVCLEFSAGNGVGIYFIIVIVHRVSISYFRRYLELFL